MSVRQGILQPDAPDVHRASRDTAPARGGKSGVDGGRRHDLKVLGKLVSDPDVTPTAGFHFLAGVFSISDFVPQSDIAQRASQNFEDEKMLRKVSVKQGLISSFSHDFLVLKGQPFLDLFSTFSSRQKSLTSPVMKGVRK